jgi:CheY-like chemotaxis protein
MLPSPDTKADCPSAERGSGDALRVLIIEDNVDAARLLAILLRTRGYSVNVAHDGASALAEAARERPDVMLVDLGLPDMSGYELARQVRADPSLASVHLIALTGYGGARARAHTAACGFDHHLVKPLDRDELEALLANAPSPRHGLQQTAPETGVSAAKYPGSASAPHFD